MRYDAVFLDVDGTLLWVNMDVEGYVEDLSPYCTNGPLTVERAKGPVWDSLRTHIRENLEYPTAEDLADFRLKYARRVARSLDLEAPDDVLREVQRRRTSFNPYPESEGVLMELKRTGVPLYAVSNWDVELETVLEELGWLRFFDGLVVSAQVGIEKPDKGIFEEALKIAGVSPQRALMVGNDPVSDVHGAVSAGIPAVLVNRKGLSEAGETVAVLPDLRGLPAIVMED